MCSVTPGIEAVRGVSRFILLFILLVRSGVTQYVAFLRVRDSSLLQPTFCSLMEHYTNLNKSNTIRSSLVVMLPVIVLVKDNSILTNNGLKKTHAKSQQIERIFYQNENECYGWLSWCQL